MINIPKGTKDVLPDNSYKWQYIEKTARDVAKVFNVREIRTPTFEHTELFARGVGDTTDIVNKEMYTFEDKGGRSVTLKPEFTAAAVRLFVENGLASTPMPVKTYYISPAFRYERPQAGRLREFHQFGVEAFGSPSPEMDAEVILIASTFLKKLGIKGANLEINSIGCPECRKKYNAALKSFFKPKLDCMCQNCRTRYDKNPLRMLDCKEEECKKISADAPAILDYLCDDCAAHFDKVKSLLTESGVEYTVNPNIVRGLDYYTRTVFEFISGEIGAQSAVLAGGRYDNLVKELGGPSTPAVGFAVGIERLMLLMENTGTPFPDEEKITLYIAGMDDESRAAAFKAALALREKGVSCEIDHMGRSLKAQMKYADKLGARFVAVIGGEELSSGVLNVKNMADGTSVAVKYDDLYSYFVKEI